MFRESDIQNLVSIKVVGVGGGGNNAVNRMIATKATGIDFIAVNSDSQALYQSLAPTRLHIGDNSTRGLGAGGNPEQGQKAANESKDEIYEILEGSDMVFITAGMGGGTGTGAAPIIARAAREQGALTIGVVTRPFLFEGNKRALVAEDGIEELKKQVDTLIVIPNDRLLELTDRYVSLLDAFHLADDVLRQGIQSISELITTPGLINLDFADVRAIMSVGGAALMAIGHGKGEDRARIAAEQALNSRLLDIKIDGAQGIIFNVTGGPDISLHEINQAASIIKSTSSPDANFMLGTVINEDMSDEMQITLIATGFDRSATRLHMFPEVRANSVAEPERQSEKKEKGLTKKKSDSRRLSLQDNLEIPAFLRRQYINSSNA